MPTANQNRKASASPAVSLKIEEITPTKARQYLTHNTGNRRLRKGVVTRYAVDMKAENWRMTGDPIVFADNGTLVQGQHRLHACIEADTPFTTPVMRNVPPESYAVMDQGEKRTFSDLLEHMGETNTTNLSAAIHLSWRWDNGQIRSTLMPTRSEALEWLEKNPGIREALRIPVGVTGFFPLSQAATLNYRFSQVDDEAAEEFFSKLASGAGLPTGNPILTLRNFFVARKREARTTGKANATARTPALAMAIKSWNAYITGNEILQLRWKGATEVFPHVYDTDGSPFQFPDVLNANAMSPQRAAVRKRMDGASA